MQDVETQSLWSQVSGQCISGPLEGTVLTQVPALHTTFREFARRFPKGLLLRKPARGPRGSPYDSYFADENRLGVFGRANTFRKLKGKDKVFGLRLADKEIAVSAAYLAERGYALISSTSPPVVVVYDQNGKTAVAFSLLPDSEAVLEVLEVDDSVISLVGREAAWDAHSGKSQSEGTVDLSMVPLVTAYWFAWVSFFPETKLVK